MKILLRKILEYQLSETFNLIFTGEETHEKDNEWNKLFVIPYIRMWDNFKMENAHNKLHLLHEFSRQMNFNYDKINNLNFVTGIKYINSLSLSLNRRLTSEKSQRTKIKCIKVIAKLGWRRLYHLLHLTHENAFSIYRDKKKLKFHIMWKGEQANTAKTHTVWIPKSYTMTLKNGKKST